MRLPLLFKFNQAVHGNGFIAGVRVNGRALLEDEWGEVWISGVTPAGFAGGGKDRATALVDFRQRWADILFDIATDASSFQEFKATCETFLKSQADAVDREWETALAEVRAKQYVDPSLPSQPVKNQPLSFEVIELVPASSNAAKNEEVVVSVALAAA